MIQEEGIGEIALVKIDTEGSELEVLDGIAPAAWRRIKHLTLEVHNEAESLPEVLEILRSHSMRPTIDEESRDPFGTVVVAATHACNQLGRRFAGRRLHGHRPRNAGNGDSSGPAVRSPDASCQRRHAHRTPGSLAQFERR